MRRTIAVAALPTLVVAAAVTWPLAGRGSARGATVTPAATALGVSHLASAVAGVENALQPTTTTASAPLAPAPKAALRETPTTAAASGPGKPAHPAHPPATVHPAATARPTPTVVRPAVRPPSPPTGSGGGCAAADAYLATHAAPGFRIECPGYALGHQAMTCINEPGVCPNAKLIVIAVVCPASYMNEASNSWVLAGLRSAPIDPYGYCP